jgi:hypothetical protein
MKEISLFNIAQSLLAVLVSSQPAFALSYTFTKIGAATSQFPFVGAWDLNDAGIVAFQRTKSFPNNDFTELYIGNGITALDTLIVKTGDTVANQTLGFLGYADINNNNVVSFRGLPVTGGDAIFIGDGITTTPIFLGGTGGLGNTTINNGNKVAFIDQSVSTFYIGNPLTAVASVGLIYNGFGSFLGINDSDTVAFLSLLNSGASEIRSSSPPYTTTNTIASGTGTVYHGQLAPINNNGYVLYAEGNAAGITLYVGDGISSPLFIADNAGITNSSTTGYIGFGWYDLNDFNNVVFVAFRPGVLGGGSGIYFGPNSVSDKLIEKGDFLLGKQVFDVTLGGINNSCQVSFTAVFLDGNSLYTEAYRADPTFRCGKTAIPEPSSAIALLALGALGTASAFKTAASRKRLIALFASLSRSCQSSGG